MSVAPVLLVSIHPARNTVNTFRQNRHYTPLISTYLIESNFVMALHVSATILFHSDYIKNYLCFTIICYLTRDLATCEKTLGTGAQIKSYQSFCPGKAGKQS